MKYIIFITFFITLFSLTISYRTPNIGGSFFTFSNNTNITETNCNKTCVFKQLHDYLIPDSINEKCFCLFLVLKQMFINVFNNFKYFSNELKKHSFLIYSLISNFLISKGLSIIGMKLWNFLTNLFQKFMDTVKYLVNKVLKN